MEQDQAHLARLAYRAGLSRSVSRPTWLRAVEQSEALAHLRADGMETVRQVCVVLAAHADHATMLTRPGHDRVCELAGITRRHLARIRVLLESAGLLLIVTPGRPEDILEPEAGPVAQAYLLTVPQGTTTTQAGAPVEIPPVGPVPVDEHGTPLAFLPKEKRKPLHARVSARYAGDETQKPALDEIGSGSVFALTQVPMGRMERLAAAEAARLVDPVLRRVSTVHVAALFRTWHLAGWSTADIRYALVNRPDGSLWPHSLVAADVRHVPGWVRHRLAAWLQDPTDPTSPAGPSRTQITEAARRQAQDRHEALVVAHEATRAAAVAPTVALADWGQVRAEQRARAQDRRAALVAARHAAPTIEGQAQADQAAPVVRPVRTGRALALAAIVAETVAAKAAVVAQAPAGGVADPDATDTPAAGPGRLRQAWIAGRQVRPVAAADTTTAPLAAGPSRFRQAWIAGRTGRVGE
jgi:hypothetical protein